MPRPPRVKFDEDGRRCPVNLQKLRRLPECGIFDRDQLPFHPVNPEPPPEPPPDDPFKPRLGPALPGPFSERLVPDQPERPNPVFPGRGELVGGATGPGSQFSAPRLPQDETNTLVRGSGRVLHEEYHLGQDPRGYHSVPTEVQGGDTLVRRTGSLNFRNEEAGRVIQDLDSVFELSARVTREMESAMIETAERAPPAPRQPLEDPRTAREFRSFRRPARVEPMGAGAQVRTIGESSGAVSAPGLRQRPSGVVRRGMRNVDLELGEVPGGDVRGALAGQKRRGDYFELEQGEARYRAQVPRPRSSLPQRSAQLSRNIALATQSAKRMRSSLEQRAAGIMQDIRATTTRRFGQGYERVVSDTPGIRRAQIASGERAVGGGTPIEIEMTAPLPPVTEDITGLRDIDLGERPFERVTDAPTVVGRRAPTLSFQERLATARGGFSELSARRVAGGTAAAGAGFLAGMGVAELMGGTDYTHNRFANAAIVGGASGAAGDVFGRTAAAIGVKTFGTAATDAAAYTAARASTAILRGGAEGLLIGAATAPLDMLLNDALTNAGWSHGAANVTSSTAVGLGTTAAIGAISLAAAPETLGMSLVVGGVATAASAIFSWFSGHSQDEKERHEREQQAAARANVVSTANARKALIASLPRHGFDIDAAIEAYPSRDLLGEDQDTWTPFYANAKTLFVPRPSNAPAPTPGSGQSATGDQKRLNDLFAKHILHSLISRVCVGGAGCEDLIARDLGELTEEEVSFLNEKTGETWRPQADMQVEMSVQELKYTDERVVNAKAAMRDAWNNEQKLPSQLDQYLVQTAYLDASFEEEFRTAIKVDAQDRVIDAYVKNQTKLEQMPPSIREAAGYDTDFAVAMDAYYTDIESSASQLEVTVQQLIELQGLSGESQRTRYEGMQFDRVKEQTDVVQSAGELAEEQDAVRQAGFYDIDQAFLETDPTAIDSWHPSDSQILQAHAAGMNLNQYVDYMHELAKGEAGDFRNLPTYNEDQLRMYGIQDRDHFFDELALAYGEGAGPQMYDYDPATRTFIPKTGRQILPNHDDANRFLSEYTPAYLTRAREQYADLVHGVNEENQARIDAYNTNLLQELTAYGDRYNEMVRSENDYIMSHGVDRDLLHYNVRDAYLRNRIEYNPLSDSLPARDRATVDESIVSQPASRGRRVQDVHEQAASRYGLSVTQYRQLKTNVGEKNLQGAPRERIAQEVADIKGVDVSEVTVP